MMVTDMLRGGQWCYSWSYSTRTYGNQGQYVYYRLWSWKSSVFRMWQNNNTSWRIMMRMRIINNQSWYCLKIGMKVATMIGINFWNFCFNFQMKVFLVKRLCAICTCIKRTCYYSTAYPFFKINLLISYCTYKPHCEFTQKYVRVNFRRPVVYGDCLTPVAVIKDVVNATDKLCTLGVCPVMKGLVPCCFMCH